MGADGLAQGTPSSGVSGIRRLAEPGVICRDDIGLLFRGIIGQVGPVQRVFVDGSSVEAVPHELADPFLHEIPAGLVLPDMRHFMQEQRPQRGRRLAEITGVAGWIMDADVVPQGGAAGEMAEDAAGSVEDADRGVVDPVAEDAGGQPDFAGCQEAAGRIASAGHHGLIRREGRAPLGRRRRDPAPGL
ncbi:hypothetical protein GXW71_10845 [Roseomonas hellenica]|uniref:Uncharacterized protein n=1 Tax=Plastoroseomonas hellenica TaxID=2687306 RepID=A0ABS5EX31_9PROT|nr:hypothetical protein [Plastoroseomonas hellenica]MBR0664849.1 hypothetical protein [Plastoroseomonas hellenica]